MFLAKFENQLFAARPEACAIYAACSTKKFSQPWFPNRQPRNVNTVIYN